MTDGETITTEWLRHCGWQATDIETAHAARDHSNCDLTPEGWFCLDEDEDSRHPLHDEVDDIAALVMFALERALSAPPEPASLRFKTSYQVAGLDGTWRIRGLETTNMAEDGTATLLIMREGVVSAPLIGADGAHNPQHVAGVTEVVSTDG